MTTTNIDSDVTNIALRTSEDAFRLRVASQRGVNGIEIVRVGAYTRGSRGAYPSAYIIGDRPDAPFANRSFSTHCLIWDVERDVLSLQSGNYDLTWEQAESGLALR